MSKIGRKAIEIPSGVEIKESQGALVVKGPKGEESVKLIPFVKLNFKENELTLTIDSDKKQARSNWGTLASLVRGAIEGVVNGFEKVLEIEGVGYKANMEGKDLVLNLGFSHPIKYQAKEGITLAVDGQKVIISGTNKQMVGQVAAEIRKYRKPEPYKGKGVRYSGEIIQRKAGKKVGSE